MSNFIIRVRDFNYNTVYSLINVLVNVLDYLYKRVNFNINI